MREDLIEDLIYEGLIDNGDLKKERFAEKVC